MRRLLGSVLPALVVVTVLVSGCGEEEGGSASDETTPTSSGSPSTGTPTPEPDHDAVDFELVDMITVTAAGGAVLPVAIPLGEDGEVQGFIAQFESDDMKLQIQDVVAATQVPEGQELYGAVVSVGCDSPTDVTVTSTAGGLVINARKVPSPMSECFAPMTTVALVVAPAA